jgi:hypothetical protein
VVSGLAQWIDYREKRKTMKVCVSRADATYSMFPHEHCSLEVMHDVAAEIGQFFERLRQDGSVTDGRQEELERGRRAQCLKEMPRGTRVPR